jgi:hypothetical protein
MAQLAPPSSLREKRSIRRWRNSSKVMSAEMKVVVFPTAAGNLDQA